MSHKICGIDEAGRGALAGELVVAGCVFKERHGGEIAALGLDDSKKIGERKREEIFLKLTPLCEYLVVYFGNKIIDKVGLSQCLKRALMAIKSHFEGCEIIYDGNCAYGVGGIKTLIRADSAIKEVSAASIIAKCSRDAQMRRFGGLYPQYGYEIHKGYGTAAHLAAISEYGSSPISRDSFKIGRKMEQKGLFDA